MAIRKPTQLLKVGTFFLCLRLLLSILSSPASQKRTNTLTFEEYAEQQAHYYDSLSRVQIKVHDELQAFIDKNVSDLKSKSNDISAEVNEYERHFSGYFALAISFIISGSLANVVGGNDSHRSKVFFFTAIVTALIAALVLFGEYMLSYSLFNRWQKNIKESITYVNSLEWGTPQAFDYWLQEHQKDVPEHSTLFLQIVEIILMIVAFACLGCWLYLRLFTTYK